MSRLAVLCFAMFAVVAAAPAFAQKGFTAPVAGSEDTTTTDATTSDEASEEDLMTTYQNRAAAYVEAHSDKAEALLLNLYLLKVRMMMNAEVHAFLSALVDYVAGLVKEMHPDSSIVAMVSATSMSDDEAMDEETTEETTEDEAMTEEATTEESTEESTEEDMTDEETTEETTEEDAMTDTGAVATGTTTVETSGSRKNN